MRIREPGATCSAHAAKPSSVPPDVSSRTGALGALLDRPDHEAGALAGGPYAKPDQGSKPLLSGAASARPRRKSARTSRTAQPYSEPTVAWTQAGRPRWARTSGTGMMRRAPASRAKG